MYFSSAIAALLSVAGLASATPTRAQVAPRCGTTIQPAFIQQLKEANPGSVEPNTLATNGNFHVKQGFNNAAGKAINRIYQVVAFTGIPPGSYGCTLNVKFPAGYTITSSGSPALNVTTLYKDNPAKITNPNNWSWNKFYPPTSPPLGQGLFGTTNLSPGQSSTINSQACPPGGGNMAFIFSIAGWVWGAASVEFKQKAGAGVYLTYNC